MAKKTAKKNGNTVAKTVASKSEKFVELAQKRTTKAINAIRSIGKLSTRGNYSYTEPQVTKICEALRAEILEIHGRFTTDPKAPKGGFEL